MNLVKYEVLKDQQIIQSGHCPTFYVHGMLASIIEVTGSDAIKITFESKKVLWLFNPRTLYKCKPSSVSEVDHAKWFSGCRYDLS